MEEWKWEEVKIEEGGAQELFVIMRFYLHIKEAIIEEGLRNQAKSSFTIEFLAQLNVCILQMYRLELLRDSLEKNILISA